MIFLRERGSFSLKRVDSLLQKEGEGRKLKPGKGGGAGKLARNLKKKNLLSREFPKKM